MFDMSAAFDCCDKDIICDKMRLYGLSEPSVQWFKSFLTGRKQCVEIGGVLSTELDVESGFPQGGILCHENAGIYGSKHAFCQP